MIAVSQLTERASSGAIDFRPPEPPDRQLDAPGVAARPRPHRLRALFIALAFAAAAAGVGARAPIVVVTCERAARGPAACSISERILGVYPLRSHHLSRVNA